MMKGVLTMKNTKLVAKDTVWIGGSDRRLALFENLFPLPNGVSYNSYVVLDEKITLFDTADVSIADQYLENLHAFSERRSRTILWFCTWSRTTALCCRRY